MPLAPAVGTQLTTPVADLLQTPSDYRIQVFAFADATSFGIGNLIADLEKVKNIGWGDYANDVPEAFFTLNQDDSDASLLGAVLGRAHVRILRGNRIVWVGWLMESDETVDDIVYYCYGYVAGLFWTLSDWKQEFTGQPVSSIVTTVWQRAKSTLSQTTLAFVATGTIEGVQNSTDGSGELTLPEYPLYYKRLLFVLQELAALGISDTDNAVLFEITSAEQPEFNWWRNRGIRRPDVRWSYGDGVIHSFRRARLPVYTRTDVKAVGSLAYNGLARSEASEASSINLFGRRQEPLYLAWVRDATELDRVTNLRYRKAILEDASLTIRLFANSVIPPGAAGAQFRMTDSIWVSIHRGSTSIDDWFRVVGYQVVVVDGEEHLNVLLQSHPAQTPYFLGLGTEIVNDSKYNAFVGGALLANGNLFACYYKATDHATTLDGKIAFKTSSDGGEMWGTEGTVYDHATLDVRDPEAAVLSDGTLIVTLRTWDGASAYAQGIIKSTDNGATFGSFIAVPTSFSAVASVARVVELPNGDLLLPVYGNNGSAYNTTAIVRSSDGGVTWGNEVTVVVGDASLDATEPYMALLQSGVLLLLIRNNIVGVGGVYACRSYDYGRTWTSPSLVIADERSKPAFAQLSNGHLVLVMRGLTTPQVFYTSSDDGLSWSAATTFDSSGVTGNYASVVALPDGEAGVIYAVENSSTDSDVKFDRVRSY